MNREFVVDKDNSININLRDNILLEASAGTGKTYSLERVVLNLIKNSDYGLSIKDILVVTFTNKATREMKERIRKILLSEYRHEKNLEIRHRLERAISDFDEASIFTIHGFCQNTLQSFPFESLSLFNQEINQDPGLLESAVWDYLRGLDKDADEKSLEEYYSFRGNMAFSSVVSELIKIYNSDDFKGECAYFPDAGYSDDIYSMWSEFNSCEGVLYNLVTQFKNYGPQLMLEASKSMSVATRVTSFEKISKGLENIDLTKGFHNFLDSFYSDDICGNLVKLTPKFLEGKSKKGLTVNDIDTSSREIILNVEEFFVNLEPLWDGKNINKNPLDKFLSGEFIKKAIKGIDICFKKKQESSGVLSYNDLIDNLHNRLIHSKDSSLLEALQKRYKVALIDEFQDTDRKQWEIFRRVFGESENHNFLLIGDPKQSIYGFRGADLEIYYKAKDSVAGENCYFLGTNYRSEKGIVTGINSIFKRVFGVKTQNNTVPTGFVEVGSSDKANRFIDGKENIEFLLYDEDVEEGKTIKASSCRRGYFKTVVTKILDLLNGDSNINPGEIAILVENHRDSISLRDLLIKRSIPVVISKQKNVYKSKEAEHILILLKALNKPGGLGEIKTLLLSPIFGYSLNEIHNMESVGELEVLSTKLLIWSQRIFTSGIISVWKEIEGSSDKGNLQLRTLSEINGERAYTNYKHLIENLNILQKSERLSCLGLYQRLHSLVQNADDNEENSVRLDRDSEAVQIMTMHASKGLEFPIVFFAGGFGSSNKFSDGFGVKYAEKNGVWTLDFLSRNSSLTLHDRDEWEERKRLYYVAFTRAANKLYLPVFEKNELMVISSLYASLKWDEIKLMVEDRAGDRDFSCEQPIHKQLEVDKKLSKELKISLSQKIYEDIESEFYVDKESYLKDSNEVFYSVSKSNKLEFSDLKSSFRNRVTWLSSYSALTKDSHGSASKEDADREDDVEEISPEYRKSDELNCFNIPGGATFGDFVHEFFEEVDFSKYKLSLDDFLIDDDVDILCKIGAKKHFDTEWYNKSHRVAKSLIWNTLNSRLKISGDEVPIGDFGPNRRIHEREFYFKVDMHNTFTTHNLELRVENGFIKGFIDLILNYNGKLFIADWKSTTIKGHESFDTYNGLNVEKSMNEHHYHLQGLIYTVALYMHLQKTKKNFSYDDDIGGYFYLFVRGMGPETDSGVSFYKPSEEEVLKFIGEIRGEL